MLTVPVATAAVAASGAHLRDGVGWGDLRLVVPGDVRFATISAGVMGIAAAAGTVARAVAGAVLSAAGPRGGRRHL